MIVVDNVIVSEEVLTAPFCCDYDACKGVCCVAGEGGAPLEEEEVEILDKIYQKIKCYMTKEGRKIVENKGNFVLDGSEIETPLMKDGACVYANYDELGRVYCGIEKAYLEKKIKFKKPISCELYPIRIKKNRRGPFVKLVYDKWSICKPAKAFGGQKNLRIFEFCKNALNRKFGQGFYKKLEKALTKN